MQTQPRTPKSRRNAGYSIVELIVVMSVMALMFAAVFYNRNKLSDMFTSQNNVSSTTALLSSVKNRWQGLGSYAGVTSAAVNTGKLVTKPMYWDGTNIKNAFDKNVVFAGQANNFVAQIDVPPENCMETVASLDGTAYRIDVHTAGIAANAAESATQTVKVGGGALDATKTETQCGGATTIVTAFIR